MARTTRGGSLESRSARLRLKPRGKPYFVTTAKAGLHLGYRRLANRNGSWIARTYQGAAGQYELNTFAHADDFSDANGGDVLDYYDAIKRASGAAPPVRRGSQYTVTDAVEDYVRYLAQQRKTAADAKSRLRTYVANSPIGTKLLSALKPADFEEWLTWAMAHKARGRLKDGKQSAAAKRLRARARGKILAPAPEVLPAERIRRRRSTLNRIMANVKAALNRAADQGHVDSRAAWARLKKFRSADSARIARLTAEQARRLVLAAEPDFAQLVHAALVTGCRYGELRALRVKDVDATTILVADSKAGRPRRVPLTKSGQTLFAGLVKDKAPDDLVFVRADGVAWGKSEQQRRMAAACAVAKISPAVGFHSLRHTYASLLVEAKVPLPFVAEALGHSDTRMVSKHYAHLAPSIVFDAIRANLPSFAPVNDTDTEAN